MSPTRPSVLPAVLRLLSLLPLLLPTPPGVRGDCGPPPEVPNAQPILGGSTSFPEKTAITYKCNEGFVKIPGNPDSVVCLSNNQWSEFIEFCNRSCDVPTRLLFASLKKDYNMQNYFPVGSTVEYECRPGYIRNPFQSVKLTCLQNLTWSKAAEFCKKKSCPNPGELRNGDINITTGLFYGSPIFFSCHTGYRLVGESSSYCTLFDRTLKWSEPLPECVEIYCPEPIQIDNGYIQEEQEVYVYRQSITYGCNKGFNLVGKSSIYCTVTEDEGEWSDPPPQCIGKSSGYKPSPTAQKPTTVSVPGTRAPSTPQKPTTTSVPATQRPSVPKATTSFHTTRVTERKETSPSGAVSLIYGFVAAAIIIGILILVKIFWDYGKSGAHMYNFDSFACDARNHWLSDLAKEELKKKVYSCTQNTCSLLERSGEVDTINAVVLYVLHVILGLKVYWEC
ncbi:complement decay-accelerating factor isoform X4 [Ictidomys tridecemlineatus]|uniref:complement decay-accelerating factor isoform X4 n=1 Tax=Ictidomys tridecemlineatus TaxID=43179 RepID=UPI000B54723E|nr:complement decay-accelerating factor isoform X4 [Ictidomys tridecemlineatus]KAG3258217.1 CD55 molecule (Cromer blood group), transcript variant X2 [Ictidomys tridecemlineatus]